MFGVIINDIMIIRTNNGTFAANSVFLERIVQLLFKNSDFVLAVTFQNLLF